MQPSRSDPSTGTRGRKRRATAGIAALGALALAGTLTLPASAQRLPREEVARPGEILANPGFDAKDSFAHPVEWSVLGAGASNVVVINRAADKMEGPSALEVTNNAGAGVTVASRKQIATAGSTYTLTGQSKLLKGTGASVLMRFYDFNNKIVGEESHVVTEGGDFKPFTLTGTAPATADLVTILITGTQSTQGTTIFDAFSLQSSEAAYDPKLGTERELFLDDHRIESAHDVGREVHPGKKLDAPVIRADKPWEVSAYTYGSVIRDGDQYRLWYTCYNDVAPNYFLCYAESTDGVAWTKPNLGLVDWKGSKENNIVQPGAGTIVQNPDAPADQRYAQLTYRAGTVNDTMGYYGRVSPDGLRWTDVSDKPLLLDGDVSNLAYDQRTHRYIATVKKRMFTADTDGYERSAFVATSTDFKSWTRPQLGVMGDLADDGGAFNKGGLESQIYGMPVLPYESVYVGVPWVFDILNFTSGEYKTAADGPVTPQLASSRDLLHWDRPEREPLIEPGRTGAWDDGALYTASNIVVDDKQISMYYAGFNNGHGGADPDDPNRDNHHGQTGLATWRRDGFASMGNHARPGLGDAGELITKPVEFSGEELHLNSTVRAGGSLTVEVLDLNGKPIPGFTSTPVRGDKLDTTVQFGRAKVAQLKGQQVKFKFSLVDADLYAYWLS